MAGPRAITFLALLLLAAAPATAQQPGGGEAAKPDAAPPPPAAPAGPAEPDYREEMRTFVRSIATFAGKHRRDFVIIAQNGLELLEKADPAGGTKKSPARAYMRAIDGVLQEALFFGDPDFDKPPPAKRRKERLRLADLAKSNGLRVLVMDYARTRKAVNRSHRLGAARGYVSFAAHGRGPALSGLPPYPRRPFDENPASVLSLKDVRNFLYLRKSLPLGSQDEFALALRATNFDMVVLDVFHGRTPLTKRTVETLKYKKLGARRLVLAYMDIGRAARYRYYWKPGWREGKPKWIGEPVRGEPDTFQVEYWRPGWQKIITGDAKSYVFGIIDLGFDGVVLDGVDAFRNFERQEEVDIESAGQSAQ